MTAAALRLARNRTGRRFRAWELGLDRATVVRTALAVAAFATFIYSEPLWRAHALPPQVPPFPVSPPGWLDLPCYVAALAALVVLVSGRGTAGAAATFLAAMLVLCLGDQHRWQPEFQMFALF